MIEKDNKILFIGDSITDCGRDRNDETSLGNGFVNMMAASILYQFPDLNLTFYNKGISGDRVCDVQARLKEDCLQYNPDIVSILVGVNDTWAGLNGKSPVVSPKEFRSNYLDLLIDIMKKSPRTKLVLVEPFILSDNLPEDYSAFYKDLTLKREIIMSLANKYDVAFVPLQDAFKKAKKKMPKDGYWLSDGIHPTPAGHMLIFQEWIQAF